MCIYMAYWLEGRYLTLATGDVVDDETSSGLASVLIIEELPDACQYE
jgi:hypothetical protein